MSERLLRSNQRAVLPSAGQSAWPALRFARRCPAGTQVITRDLARWRNVADRALISLD